MGGKALEPGQACWCMHMEAPGTPSGVGGWARCDFSKYFPVPPLTVQLFGGGEVLGGGQHWNQGRHAGACLWKHLAHHQVWGGGPGVISLSTFPSRHSRYNYLEEGRFFWGGKHWNQGRHAGACIWKHLAAYEGQEMLREGGCLTFGIAALPATHVLPPWWLLLSPSCLWGSIGKVE